MKSKKLPNLSTLKTLYDKMSRACTGSYVMFVGNAFEAGKQYAESKGIELYYDVGIFPEMFKYIKSYVLWENVPNFVKDNMQVSAVYPTHVQVSCHDD